MSNAKKNVKEVWQRIFSEAQEQASMEPMLASFYHASILNHTNFCSALAFHISSKLGCSDISSLTLNQVFERPMQDNPQLSEYACLDLQACFERDPACDYYSMPFLFFKVLKNQ